MKNNNIKSERMWNVCKRYVLRMFYVFMILFTIGIGQMWGDTKRIYLHPGGSWSDANAKFTVWDGSTNQWFTQSSVQHDGKYFWYADINSTATSAWIKRVDPSCAKADCSAWNEYEANVSSYNMFYCYSGTSSWSAVNIIGLVEGGYIYFDNSVTQWTGKIQFVIGHDTYSKAYEMSQITGTQIWYVSIQNEKWRDANYYAFGAKASVVTETNWTKTDLSTKFTKYTAAYTSKYYLSKDATYMCTPSAAANNSSFSISYKSSGYSAIASTYTHNLYVRTRTQLDGSTPSYGTSMNSPTTVNIKGYQMTGNGASTQQTSSVTTSSKSTTLGSIISTSTVSSDYTALDATSAWTFDGWAENTSGPSNTNSTYSITNAKAAKSIYAYFSKRTYTVSFNMHSYGDAVSDQVKDYYALVSEPSAPTTSSAYVFRGWWKESTYVNQWNFSSDHVTTTTTLHAKWLAYVNVAYNKGAKGTGTNATDKKVTGENLTLRGAIFTRTGYTQTGWSTTDGGDKAYNLSATYSTQSALNLYPFWTANSYDVILDVNGGSGANQTVRATYDAAMPTRLKGGGAIAARTKTGYTFGGYYANSNGTGTQYYTNALASANPWNVATNNQHIYAKWTANNYRVTFDVDEDHQGTTTGATAYQDVTYDGATTTVPNRPTAANGYALTGYYTDHNGAGTKVINGDGTWIASVDGYTDGSKHWMHDGDVTLYAYYQKAEVSSITFSTAGVPGSVIAPSTTTTVTATISPTPVGTTTICWRVLHNNGNPLEDQPTFSPASGSAVSFTTSATSGSYLIEARLRLGSGCSGTVLDSVTSVFQVAGDHDVTILYKDASGNIIKASETVTGRPLAWSDNITAPTIFGYTFARWDAGDGVTIKNGDSDPVTTSTDATIKIKATYDGRLTAVYNQKNIIYFKNTLGWSNVYVNFLNGSYWDTDQGTGNKNLADDRRNKQMTLVPGETDVYYYDYGSTITIPTEYVSFLDRSLDNYSGFEGTESNPVRVCYPTIPNPNNAQTEMAYFGFYSKTPMFVPSKAYETATSGGDLWNHSKARYCNSGYWTKYTPGTGYYLRIYDPNDASRLIQKIEFTSEDDLIPMTATANLEANKTYKFEVSREDQQFYSNGGSMDYDDRYGQGVAWELFRPDTYAKTSFVTTADGDYIFHLTHSAENTGHVWRLRIAAEYPIADGDYRVLYKDNVHTLWHPSAIVAKANNRKDTVSFFIRPGKSPIMKIQQATVNGSGAISWGNYSDISSSLSSLTKDSVYNICLTMNGSGAITVENVTPYTGNYYIRTDAANSKWSNYRSDPDHLMTYSEYSITHGGYSHYYCHWVTTADAYRKNVKFVIANDYSPCISDTLTRETAADEWANIGSFINASGELLRSANVRFMWDQSTNKISRAYLDPAKNDDNFLVLASSDSKIANQSEVVQSAVVFSDNENWIYEANVKAKPNAQIKLVATWGDAPTTIVQYFKGTAESTETLITGSGTDWYNIRLIYDYKTNRLIAAMLPSGNITESTPINADVMFIREHQGDIAQLTFSGEGSRLTEIKTAYGVMRFNKWTLNNKEKTGSHTPLASPLSRYERDLFYISFPFRVNLNEVFGFGTYGVHWIVQEYDGAARATNGLWKDTPSYWRFITNRKGKYLEPNVGYLLALDLEELGETSSVWTNGVENVELFFPSCETMPDIKSSSVTHTLPSHVCSINRPTPQGDRRISDSHWNIMSVPTYVNVNNPTFANTTWTTEGEGHLGPKFLYTWNADDNTLTPTTAAGFKYHAMHAYTVQYYGNVTWTTSVSPSSIVARKQAEPSAYEWCLELQQNNTMIDRTYVRMSNEEEVTTGFEFGYDMSKSIEWSKANIYTFIGTEWVAGNSLPIETEQTTIVPVGLTLATAGDYTFAMPEGTHGVGVILVDTQTNERTNLSAGMTQTVTLAKGDHLNRFYLEISPIHNAPTGIEEVTGDGLPVTGARKVLIDGILYIVKGDKLYDVRGTMIK